LESCPNTDFAIELSRYHGFLCATLAFVFVLVLVVAYSVGCGRYRCKLSLPYGNFELALGLVPLLILVVQVLPGIWLLYQSGYHDFLSPVLTFKVIGHQWYWTYEVMDLEFDSFMLSLEDIPCGGYRNLEVDNRLVVPFGVPVRFCVSRDDVIHSWSLTGQAIKVDAVPGQLNVISAQFNLPAVMYGQCSEICGAYHSFMPIVVEVVSPDVWVEWYSSQLRLPEVSLVPVAGSSSF